MKMMLTDEDGDTPSPKKGILVNGWDVSRTWEDEINMSDNNWTKAMQRVFIRIQGTCVPVQADQAVVQSSDIIGSPGRLKVRFTGSRMCYLIYGTTANCPCSLCKDWKKYELTTFQDSNRTYGLVALERADMVRGFDLCWNHEMKMGMIPWSRKSSAQLSDLTMDVKGQSHDMICKATLKFGSESSSVILEVFSGESMDLNPRTITDS
ncbi:hypothetical protein EC991_008935, partial [Linnemannia zychae]